MFENPRRGRQARNFKTNVPKILELKLSVPKIDIGCPWCKWKARKNLSAWSGNKGAVAGKKKGETIIRNYYRLCRPSSPQFLSLIFWVHAFSCRPDYLGAWNGLSGSSCFVQKGDNAILWIYLYPVHNPISCPNIIDCWTVFHPQDSGIYLNNQADHFEIFFSSLKLKLLTHLRGITVKIQICLL